MMINTGPAKSKAKMVGSVDEERRQAKTELDRRIEAALSYFV